MCQYPLFETLAVIDGQFRRIEYHQQRVDFSFQSYFKTQGSLDLNQIKVPEDYQQGFFRCRIDYNAEEYQIGFFPYSPKKINCFQSVYVENFDYQFKYSNRKRLDLLKNLQAAQSDEVIIINNGWVSDCTIGNLLFLKNQRWYSPADYLLKGTQLSYLLAEKQVELLPIRAEDLLEFEAIMMINALNPFDPARAIPINPQTILR